MELAKVVACVDPDEEGERDKKTLSGWDFKGSARTSAGDVADSALSWTCLWV